MPKRTSNVEIQEEGVLLEAIREEIDMDDIDDFDLICHLAYDKPPLTKKREPMLRRDTIYINMGVARKY